MRAWRRTLAGMGALVVYESMFGSTRAVAEAIAAGLEGAGTEVRTVEVGAADAQVPDDVSLLVVGGPTHAFGMSRASTREDSRKHAADGTVVSPGIGVRDWLGGLDLAGRDILVAAFGTKVRKPNLPGSAAKGIDKELRRHGGRPVTPARDFGVIGYADGLVEGELDAARAWGTSLAAGA